MIEQKLSDMARCYATAWSEETRDRFGEFRITKAESQTAKEILRKHSFKLIGILLRNGDGVNGNCMEARVLDPFYGT